MHVKKGDTVLVLSGNDKGKQGVVKTALPRDGKVIIEGINLRWRHQKPTQQRPKGDRVQREAPLYACKVKLLEGKAAKKGARKSESKKSESQKTESKKA